MLIKSCVDLAVECALRRESGVTGHDEDQNNVLRAIEFSRIKGGKPFNPATPWFADLLASIGQPKGATLAVKH
jgi:pyrophosphate--fructose-6-phosphate 1-phosphotransferase